MPLIENDILPTLDPSIEFVAIHTWPHAEQAGHHVQWFGLTFPMVLDFDSELFRHYRLPEWVYPLNFVVDQQGDVAYVGTDLNEAVAAAEALVP